MQKVSRDKKKFSVMVTSAKDSFFGCSEGHQKSVKRFLNHMWVISVDGSRSL